jgi:hypothetical protein
MPQHPLTSQVGAIRATLQAIEAQLDKGRIPLPALEDFKRAVDDVRLRVWSIMASASTDDSAPLERFRIRRAVDIITALATDAAAGNIQLDHREWADLKSAIQRLETERSSRS